MVIYQYRNVQGIQVRPTTFITSLLDPVRKHLGYDSVFHGSPKDTDCHTLLWAQRSTRLSTESGLANIDRVLYVFTQPDAVPPTDNYGITPDLSSRRIVSPLIREVYMVLSIIGILAVMADTDLNATVN